MCIENETVSSKRKYKTTPIDKKNSNLTINIVIQNLDCDKF